MHSDAAVLHRFVAKDCKDCRKYIPVAVRLQIELFSLVERLKVVESRLNGGRNTFGTCILLTRLPFPIRYTRLYAHVIALRVIDR